MNSNCQHHFAVSLWLHITVVQFKVHEFFRNYWGWGWPEYVMPEIYRCRARNRNSLFIVSTKTGNEKCITTNGNIAHTECLIFINMIFTFERRPEIVCCQGGKRNWVLHEIWNQNYASLLTHTCQSWNLKKPGQMRKSLKIGIFLNFLYITTDRFFLQK